MTTAMQELFDQTAGLALSRQRDLGERIGSHDWGFDMDAGTMTFTKRGFLGIGGEKIATACQVLGSESELSRTWLWAWANQQSGIPAALLTTCGSLRARGDAQQIEELTTPSLPLDAWDGHRLAMIASGLTADCAGYYRGPYPNGALFVLLTGRELIGKPVPAMLRFTTIMPELVSAGVHDHGRAAAAFARALGLTANEEPSRVVVSDGKSTASIELDAQRRMTQLSSQLSP